MLGKFVININPMYLIAWHALSEKDVVPIKEKEVGLFFAELKIQ